MNIISVDWYIVDFYSMAPQATTKNTEIRNRAAFLIKTVTSFLVLNQPAQQPLVLDCQSRTEESDTKYRLIQTVYSVRK